MAQHSLSPLVQVMQQPSFVISHLQWPIIRLQQQAIIPFIIMQQLHIPPAIIMQRFCIMPADTLSSQTQVIFMPPAHFSNFMVQRGTIIMFGAIGIPVAAPVIVPGPMPVIPADVFSIIIVVAISWFSAFLRTCFLRAIDSNRFALSCAYPCLQGNSIKNIDTRS